MPCIHRHGIAVDLLEEAAAWRAPRQQCRGAVGPSAREKKAREPKFADNSACLAAVSHCLCAASTAEGVAPLQPCEGWMLHCVRVLDCNSLYQRRLPYLQVSPASLPAPSDSAVQLQRRSGGIYAAALFSGVATPRRCLEVSSELLSALQGARLKPVNSSSWMLARYNDPSVKPRFRRNEILVELQDFDLWG